jgi:hypothetical protein
LGLGECEPKWVIGMDERIQLSLRVDAGGDADAEEVAKIAAQLRRELLDLDLEVEAVEFARTGPAPVGSKAVDVLAVGTLLITLAKSSGLAAVVGAVQSWLSGRHQRSVKIEIGGDTLEVTGVTSDQQRRLIDDWIARHKGR